MEVSWETFSMNGMYEVCPLGGKTKQNKKTKHHNKLQQKSSSPEILPPGADNTYLFSRIGGDPDTLVLGNTKNVDPAIKQQSFLSYWLKKLKGG